MLVNVSIFVCSDNRKRPMWGVDDKLTRVSTTGWSSICRWLILIDVFVFGFLQRQWGEIKCTLYKFTDRILIPGRHEVLCRMQYAKVLVAIFSKNIIFTNLLNVIVIYLILDTTFSQTQLLKILKKYKCKNSVPVAMICIPN